MLALSTSAGCSESSESPDPPVATVEGDATGQAADRGADSGPDLTSYDDSDLGPSAALTAALERTTALPGLAVTVRELDSGAAVIQAQADLVGATGVGTTKWIVRDPMTGADNTGAVLALEGATYAGGDGQASSPMAGCWADVSDDTVDRFIQHTRPATFAGLDLLASARSVARTRASREVVRARVPLRVAVRHLGVQVPVLRGEAVETLSGTVPIVIDLDAGYVSRWTLPAVPVYRGIRALLVPESEWWAGAQREVSIEAADVTAPEPPDSADLWGYGEGDCAGGVGVDPA